MRHFQSVSIERSVVVSALMIALAGCLPVPENAPESSVDDQANVLSATVERDLEKIATSIDDQNGGALLIVTVRSLEGRSIEAVADEYGKEHSPGDHGGVVLLVAPNDQKVRISTSNDMMPRLTNAEAEAIIGQMLQWFKEGDMEAGITKGAMEVSAEMTATGQGN